MANFKVGDRVQTIDGGYSFDPIGGVVEEVYEKGIFITIDEREGRSLLERSGWCYNFDEVEPPSDIAPETSERDAIAKQFMLLKYAEPNRNFDKYASFDQFIRMVAEEAFDLADAYMIEKARRSV